MLATAAIGKLGGASMTLNQSVRRGDEVLVEGDITIACVDSAGVSPRRMPRDMLDALRGWRDGQQ